MNRHFIKFTAAQFCQNIHFLFDKAIFQYPVHNSKSLIAMLSTRKHFISPKPKGPSEINVITIDLYYLSFFKEICWVVKSSKETKITLKTKQAYLNIKVFLCYRRYVNKRVPDENVFLILQALLSTLQSRGLMDAFLVGPQQILPVTPTRYGHWVAVQS